jgi:hypothetical protein
MPGLNQTGPVGQGPKTGRGMGRCNPVNKGKTDDEILLNKDSSLEPEQRLGRGSGMGRGQGGPGRGLGRQNRFRGGN